MDVQEQEVHKDLILLRMRVDEDSVEALAIKSSIAESVH
jgi:hypothetical protein